MFTYTAITQRHIERYKMTKDIKTVNAEKLNALVASWLYQNTSNTVEVDGREFELRYTGDSYSISEDGEELGWNDNHKDFCNIGYHVFHEYA